MAAAKKSKRRYPRRAATKQEKAELLRRSAKTDGDLRLAAALDAWKSLPVTDQRRLVLEIAETRGPELIGAHPGLVSVGHGFRRRALPKGKPAAQPTGQLTSEPSVLFMVARKWRRQPKSMRMRARHLPRYLWAYADDPEAGTTRGTRILCAVPTDVISATDYRLRPGSGAGAGTVRVTREGVTPQRGTLACAVREGPGGKLFGLTCHHVAAMSTADGQLGEPAPRAQLHLRGEDTAFIGELAALPIGLLVPDDSTLSFDAALVEVDESDPSAVQALATACCGARPSVFHDDPAAIPLVCQFLTSHGIIDAEFAGEHFMFNRLTYFRGYPLPVQARMLEFDTVGDTTVCGDSGCAVVAFDGDVLIGLHVGGVENSLKVFALPGYLLAAPENWNGLFEPLVLAT